MLAPLFKTMNGILGFLFWGGDGGRGRKIQVHTSSTEAYCEVFDLL